MNALFGPVVLAASVTSAVAAGQTAPGPRGVDPGAPPAASCPEPAAWPAPAPETKRFATGTHVGGFVQFSESPGVLLGVTVEGFLVLGGVTFRYDGNGIPNRMGTPTDDKISTGLLLGGAYLVYNRHPIAFGPALNYATSFAPGSAFDRQMVMGSLAVFMAPFPAPISFIALLSTRLTLERSRDPIFELVTPSLLVGYLIY